MITGGDLEYVHFEGTCPTRGSWEGLSRVDEVTDRSGRRASRMEDEITVGLGAAKMARPKRAVTQLGSK
jgi:hypothetical protein